MPYTPPARLTYWESRLPYVNGVDRPYVAGEVDPDGGGGYYLDQDDHYDPGHGFRAIQAYSIARGLAVTDYSVQIDAAQVRFRDRAVLAVNGTVENEETPGVQDYHRYLGGIADHYLLTSDPDDVLAADVLLAEDAYSNIPMYLESWDHTGLQREAAFVLMTALDRERMGLGEHTITDSAAEVCLSHISQWTAVEPRYGVHLKPFMGALSMRALIAYWDRYRDSEDAAKVANCAAIPPAVKALCDYVWDSCWFEVGVPVDIGGGTMWDKGAVTYRDIANDDPRWVPIEGNAVTAVVDPRRIVRGPATLSDVDDYYKGAAFITSGVPYFDQFQIIGYTGATREIELSNYYNLPIDATTADTFTIRPTAWAVDEGPGPTPDLNHMVFPAFAWAYYHAKVVDGDDEAAATFRERAHAIFDGDYHSYNDPYQQKTANQTHLWTTDGLGWLEAADVHDDDLAAGEDATILLLPGAGGTIHLLRIAAGAAVNPDPDIDPDPDQEGPITPAMIQVHHSHDEFLDPCYSYDIFAVQDGDWSDPATWSGAVPTATDRVVIADYTVTVDDTSAVAGPVLVMGTGILRHSYTADNLLICDDLIGIETARWEAHGATEDDPIPAAVTWGVTLRDTPLGTAAEDPRQHRRGVIWTGTTTVRLRGASKTTFASELRLAVEPHVGHTTLTFESAPTGWLPGDTVVIPPTGPYGYAEGPGVDYLFEEKTIASVAGAVVTLTTPLVRDHLGAADPTGQTPTLLPHAVNITRNGMIRSANPTGTRGHVIFAERCDARLHHVAIHHMGRTRGSFPFGDGTTTAWHENQKGRYAVHRHHNMGPLNPGDTGYQGELVGCALYDSRKWPIAVHGSSYQLIEGNNVFWGEHSLYSNEDGNEGYNSVDDNVFFGVYAGFGLSPTEDTGTVADVSLDWVVSNGLWILQPGRNNFRRNVAAGGRGSAYFPHGFHLDALRRGGETGNMELFEGYYWHHFPLHRGADVMHGTLGTDYERVQSQVTNFGECSGNEFYAHNKAFSFDHFSGLQSEPLVVSNTTAWNCYVESLFIYGGYQDITIDGLTVRGRCTSGCGSNTQAATVLLKNLDVRLNEGHSGAGAYGIARQGGVERFIVEDSYICAPHGIHMAIPGGVGFGTAYDHYFWDDIYRNVTVENPPGQAVPNLYEITTHQAGANSYVPCISYRCRVEGHQGTEGDDFYLFLEEQDPDFVLIAESEIPYDYKHAGLTVGHTNAQALAAHGRCWAGELTPAAAVLEPAGFIGVSKVSSDDYEAGLASPFGDFMVRRAETIDGHVIDLTLRTAGRDLLVVSVSWVAASGAAAVLTDSLDNTWTPLTKRSVGGVHNQLFYCASPVVSYVHDFRAATPTELNFNYLHMAVLATKGAHASPLLVQNGAGSASVTSVQPGSITPSQAGSLVVTGLASRTGTGHTINSGFDIRGVEARAGSLGGGIAWLVQGAAAAVNPTWTRANAADVMVASVAAFRRA